MDLLSVKFFRVGTRKISSPELGHFNSVESGQGPVLRAVRVFCGWNLANEGSRGGAWPLLWFEGLTKGKGRRIQKS